MLRHLDISKHDVSLLTTFARTVRGDLPVRAVVVSLQPHNFLKFWPNLASDKLLLSKLWNGTEFRRLLANAPPRPVASPTKVASSPLRDHCLPPPLRFVHLRSLRGQKKHMQAWFASLVPDRHAIVKQVVMSLLQLWCKHEKQAGSDNITFFEWPQCKNMVPGIWGGPRCCHFPNILQGGPIKHQEQFIIIIIICMLIILEMALWQANFSSGGRETSKLMQSFGDIHVLWQVHENVQQRSMTYVCKCMRTYSSIAWRMCASAWQRPAA